MSIHPRNPWLGIVCLFTAISLHAHVVPPAAAQTLGTEPVSGLRDHTPRTFAIVGARIVVAPGTTIPDGTIVVRDRVIIAVGDRQAVELPKGTRVLPGGGKVIYPGWIDAYDAVDAPTVESGRPYWNNQVQPQRRMAALFEVDSGRHRQMRQAGIVARLVVPKSGVIQGTSLLVATSRQPLVLRPDVAMHLRLTVPRGRGDREYPGSPMGAVALARQALYDAKWYQQAWGVYRADPRVGRPDVNDALAALAPYLAEDRLFIFDCPNERYSLRADRFAREFGLRAVLLGSGREYRRLDAIAQTGRGVIVPLAFPKAPDVGTPQAARQASLQSLMHWHLAPENPGRLARAGVRLAVTSWGIQPKELSKRVRQAVQRGWPADRALAALTIDAARMLGIERQLGSLESGKLASFLVMDGDWLDKETRLLETWVAGHRSVWKKEPLWDPRGVWEVRGPLGSWTLEVKGQPERLSGTLHLLSASEWKTRQANAKPKRRSAKKPAATIELKQVSFADDRLAIAFDGKPIGYPGIVRLSLIGIVQESGKVRADGSVSLPDKSHTRHAVHAIRVAQADDKKDSGAPDAKTDKSKRTTQQADAESQLEVPINYPLGAFGRSQTPPQPEWVLFRRATIWTCGKQGRLENCDLLVHRGRIHKIGSGLTAPPGALVIDCQGRHLTPGIVDCHSHMATDGGVNEATQAITAEVRIGDFINGDDINIYRQLAGGVTTSNILHGSANPIGGQNQVIKLRWGELGEAMKFTEAPPGIKFALGENVKQSNWGDEYTTRYPQTRMGVEQIMRDAFHEAKRYHLRWRQWEQTHRGLPPRRDLELEALAEILEHRRWIHCHSYRQDEILALLRTLEEFNVRIGTLQHILEGYKVAGAMKRHGAMASAFSDWWAYKFEVYDAIPHNGAIMHDVGIVVSFNSDDREMARHLNHEAAKGVKYGGVAPEEALKFVTLNPARQLRIDRWVGSLEPGKHADIAVWSGPPLSTLSRCEQTWIDGRKYFDRAEDVKKRQDFEQLKAALIQKVLTSGAPMLTGDEQNATRDREWPSYDEYCRCHPRQEEQR